MEFDITGSLVTYENDPDEINRVIESFLSAEKINSHLFISDNSETTKIKDNIIKNEKITFIRNEANLGFGGGHNKIIKQYAGKSKYHVILNPDVYFGKNVISGLADFMDREQKVAMVVPKVFYPDGSIQDSCRNLPTFSDLLIRRLPFGAKLFSGKIKRHIIKTNDIVDVLDIPFPLGCFYFVRSEKLLKIKGFDERFFMYMEDLDLSRRISKLGRVVINPRFSINHSYGKASRKNSKMFFLHLSSMIKYFNKWGWIIDRDKNN